MRFTRRVCLAVGILAISGGGLTGTVGWVSHAAAPAAEKREAITHVDGAGAGRLLSTNRTVLVLDVRTPREFARGHIQGATNVDFNGSRFSAEVGKLDRDKTYLVHCAGGGRSTKSLEVFKKLGFRSIIHLDGGLSAWEAAGQPVTEAK